MAYICQRNDDYVSRGRGNRCVSAVLLNCSSQSLSNLRSSLAQKLFGGFGIGAFISSHLEQKEINLIFASKKQK